MEGFRTKAFLAQQSTPEPGFSLVHAQKTLSYQLLNYRKRKLNQLWLKPYTIDKPYILGDTKLQMGTALFTAMCVFLLLVGSLMPASDIMPLLGTTFPLSLFLSLWINHLSQFQVVSTVPLSCWSHFPSSSMSLSSTSTPEMLPFLAGSDVYF